MALEEASPQAPNLTRASSWEVFQMDYLDGRNFLKTCRRMYSVSDTNHKIQVPKSGIRAEKLAEIKICLTEKKNFLEVC